MEGADSDRATSELASYADKLLMLKGLQQSHDVEGCAHKLAIAQCMTSATLTKIEEDGVRVNKLHNTILRAHGVNEDFGTASLEGGPINSLMA